MLKLIVCTALVAHGIGHVLFLAPTLRVAAWADQSGHSWLAAPLIGDGLARVLCSAAWAAALVLFVAAAVGLYVDAEWWRSAAAIGSLVSLAGVIASWGGLNQSSAFFALAFDVIVLVALAWTRFATPEIAAN